MRCRTTVGTGSAARRPTNALIAAERGSCRRTARTLDRGLHARTSGRRYGTQHSACVMFGSRVGTGQLFDLAPERVSRDQPTDREKLHQCIYRCAAYRMYRHETRLCHKRTANKKGPVFSPGPILLTFPTGSAVIKVVQFPWSCGTVHVAVLVAAFPAKSFAVAVSV